MNTKYLISYPNSGAIHYGYLIRDGDEYCIKCSRGRKYQTFYQFVSNAMGVEHVGSFRLNKIVIHRSQDYALYPDLVIHVPGFKESNNKLEFLYNWLNEE